MRSITFDQKSKEFEASREVLFPRFGQIQMEEDSPVENLLIPAVSNKFNARISCQNILLPKGFGMKNKSKPWICSVYYHSKCCMEAEKLKTTLLVGGRSQDRGGQILCA